MIDIDVNILDRFNVAAYLVVVTEEGLPHYSTVNRIWRQITKIDPQDAVGKTALEIYGNRTGKPVFARHMEVIRTGRQLNGDVKLDIKGAPYYYHSTMTPILDDDGRVIRILGMIDNKTAEESQRSILEQEAELNSDIERFFAMAAHDLRTPMINIQNITDMLRDGFVDYGDGKLELIDLLESVALKAKDLISDVLAHADATNAVKSKEVFEMSQLTADVLSVIDPMEIHSWKSDRQWLLADKTAVQISLRNLCDNAYKHANRNRLELFVSVRALDEETLEFSVRDNGAGFSDPAIAFLDGGQLRMESGFGLLGVRRMIATRGGQIGVQNLPDRQGCIVSFTLPGRFVNAPE